MCDFLFKGLSLEVKTGKLFLPVFHIWPPKSEGAQPARVWLNKALRGVPQNHRWLHPNCSPYKCGSIVSLHVTAFPVHACAGNLIRIHHEGYPSRHSTLQALLYHLPPPIGLLCDAFLLQGPVRSVQPYGETLSQYQQVPFGSTVIFVVPTN